MKRIGASLPNGHNPKSMHQYAKVACTVAKVLLALALSGCHAFGRQDASSPFNTMTSNSGSEKTLPAGESARLCLATAETMEQAGKYPEAIALYEKARQLDNRSGVQATRRLAVILDRTENFDRAREEYRRAISQNPKDPELFNNLGYSYYCQGQWDAAEKQLRKAVSLDPKLAAAWINLGMCLAQQSRYEESLSAFEKVVPKAQAHCNLGFIQATQSRTAEARRNYEMALEMEPGLQIARAALQRLGQPKSQDKSQPVGIHAHTRPDESPSNSFNTVQK